MEFDWIKVSEIVFQAILTAIISAGLVYLAFRLGQRQARHEQKEKEENEMNLMRINALSAASRHIYNFISDIIFFPEKVRIERNAYSDMNYALADIEIALPLFPKESEPDTYQILDDLKTQLYNFPRLKPRLPDDHQVKDFAEISTDKNRWGDLFKDMEERYELIGRLHKRLQENIEELGKKFG